MSDHNMKQYCTDLTCTLALEHFSNDLGEHFLAVALQRSQASILTQCVSFKKVVQIVGRPAQKPLLYSVSPTMSGFPTGQNQHPQLCFNVNIKFPKTSKKHICPHVTHLERWFHYSASLLCCKDSFWVNILHTAVKPRVTSKCKRDSM